MPVVRCPICIARVEGENVGDLSENMEYHLVEVHCWTPEEITEEAEEGSQEPEEMTEQERVSPRSFSESILSGVVGERTGYEHRMEPSAQGAEGSRQMKSPPAVGARGPGGGLAVDEKEQSFEVGDARTMAGMGGEWVQGKLVKDSASVESRGIHMEENAVDCPMCKERVTGNDEEGLSENFRSHMMETHKDEPLITQMMEEMKNR